MDELLRTGAQIAIGAIACGAFAVVAATLAQAVRDWARRFFAGEGEL